jgi:hypothetical protein
VAPNFEFPFGVEKVYVLIDNPPKYDVFRDEVHALLALVVQLVQASSQHHKIAGSCQNVTKRKIEIQLVVLIASESQYEIALTASHNQVATAHSPEKPIDGKGGFLLLHYSSAGCLLNQPHAVLTAGHATGESEHTRMTFEWKQPSHIEHPLTVPVHLEGVFEYSNEIDLMPVRDHTQHSTSPFHLPQPVALNQPSPLKKSLIVEPEVLESSQPPAAEHHKFLPHMAVVPLPQIEPLPVISFGSETSYRILLLESMKCDLVVGHDEDVAVGVGVELKQIFLLENPKHRVYQDAAFF